MTSLSVTSEFREEFEAERRDWLRRRFLWYTGIIGGLGVLNLVGAIIMFMSRVRPLAAEQTWLWGAFGALVLVGLLVTVLFVAPFFYVKRRGRGLTRERLLTMVGAIIIIAGVLNLIEIPFQLIIERAMDPEALEWRRNWMVQWISNIMVIHVMASLFIPWTPREAIRPLIPLLAFAAVFSIGYVLIEPDLPLWLGALNVSLLPLVGLPGTLISWWRHSRFRRRFSNRMLKRSYGEIKRELVDARRIHEALFPDQLDDGPVHFRYVYEPMRQIGGDFLFARPVTLTGREQPLLNVVVIDVTGHGISAALTVNRLHGEIEREFGEKPDASPGEVLHGLNAYLHHTLARHSVYATALCVRVDPNADELLWASAGHPTAFLRTAGGRVEELDSTTLLLGACRANDFYANQQRAAFHPGDALIIYTDGATETRNHEGRMLRTEGMQRLIASIDPSKNGSAGPGASGGSWCTAVLDAVDHFRHGPVKDDTLIVEIARPI